jgi:hypothetical protein
MKYFTTFITLTLVAASIGCSKHSPEAVSAPPKLQNLGIVEISDGVASRLNMGNGKVCIINPSIQKDSTVLLDMRIEESGKILSKPRVQTTLGQSVAISVGDIGVEFKPTIKQ